MNHDSTPPASTPAPALNADVSLPAEVKKKRTWGNIIYDWGIYGSIAWGGVAVLSAVSAHEALHGKNKYFEWLRNLDSKVYNGLHRFLSNTLPQSVKPETIHGLSRGTTFFLTLGMGGNALMAPLKWLEDNRLKNAAHIDTLLGTTPPDPELVAVEPKQTWKSVLSGRLLSWGGSYAAFLAMGPKITGHLSDFFSKHATTAWMSIQPKSNSANVKKWADIAAFDALFTVITASATYMISRTVAKKNGETEELRTQKPDVITELQSEAPIKRYAPEASTHKIDVSFPATSFVERTERAQVQSHASRA